MAGEGLSHKKDRAAHRSFYGLIRGFSTFWVFSLKISVAGALVVPLRVLSIMRGDYVLFWNWCLLGEKKATVRKTLFGTA